MGPCGSGSRSCSSLDLDSEPFQLSLQLYFQIVAIGKMSKILNDPTKGPSEDSEVKVDEVNEKDVGSITQIEHVSGTGQSSVSSKPQDDDGELLAEDVRPAAERRLVRMLDMRLLPTIVLIFIMNYIDVSFVIYHDPGTYQ